jgi:hypothetical protein
MTGIWTELFVSIPLILGGAHCDTYSNANRNTRSQVIER